MEPYDLWINGEKKQGTAAVIPIHNPATGDVFANYYEASDQDIDEAIHVAHATFTSGTWSRKSRHDRADVLEKAAELLKSKLSELIWAEVQQTGRALREMQAQVPSLTRWFKYYASILRTEERPVLPTSGKLHNWLDRKPLGVVVQITPFNHPLLIAIKKLAPALAAGNSVILKPSELTPITSLLLGPILQEAGLPPGVFNVLPGRGNTIGKALVSHPLVAKVDITGGTTAGKAIGAIVGGNLTRYTAELGGKAPLIVFDDADIAAAVNGIAFGAFIASGQTCIAATRIIVHRSILTALIQGLLEKAQSITRRIGSPENPQSTMGPLISLHQLEKLESAVGEALKVSNMQLLFGGERLVGKSPLDGTDLSKGYFWPPTAFVFPSPTSEFLPRIWFEELFGPVIIIVDFETEQEAIELANMSEFGLGAGIWSKDLSRAFRVSEELESGIVWVNTHHRNDPSSPWGAAKSSSGVGSENGIDAYHAYTKMKSTIINYASSEEMLANDDWFREDAAEVRYG